MNADIEPRCNPLQIDVFVQTLLFLGSKSFTHSFVAINRYYEVLKVCESINYVLLIVSLEEWLKQKLLPFSTALRFSFSFYKDMENKFLVDYSF